MGYNLKKRLSSLKQQADQNDIGRLGFGKALVLSTLLVFLLISLIEAFQGRPAQPLQEEEYRTETERLVNRIQLETTFEKASESWQKQLQRTVDDRAEWLNNSTFGAPAAERYRRFAEAVIAALPEKRKSSAVPVEGEFKLIDFAGWYRKFAQAVGGAALRIGFILFTFWPLWILGSIVGAVLVRTALLPKRTEDFLGVCHRALGPFYSGIYGPLRTNGSFSGSDYAAPSLACPAMEKKHVAIKHPLVKALRYYHALNETTLGLVQVILAYKDYPGYVDEERPVDDESTSGLDVTARPTPSFAPGGFLSNEDGTVEEAALEGLTAVLDAHRLLVRYHRQQRPPEQADPFGRTRRELSELTAKLSPFARTLVLALTPERGRALASMPPTLIAASYLATKAGKSLVFKRTGSRFTQISRFPHLQARAVIQSLVSYHKEFSGDARLVMRQAIICARRHGDFGRAFLPYNMPGASRALRDLLEVLYAHPKQREDTANLAELDAHIEELSVNWRQQLAERLRSEVHAAAERPLGALPLWKGLVHKSVVLMPLADLIEMALRGMSLERQQRILELIQLTRRLQANISISARLPGFKRQALEAESEANSGGVTQLLGSREGGIELVDRWLILRRMLTRYNWLSTRVGDDAVPIDGLVQGVLIDRSDITKAKAVGLEALAPLRQRRFKELLGQKWERVFYADAPHPNDLEILVDIEDFKKCLADRKAQAERGEFNKPIDNDSNSLSA